MDLLRLSIGRSPPEAVNALIEIPKTLCEDGDFMDIMVLKMLDRGKSDDKILAVP